MLHWEDDFFTVPDLDNNGIHAEHYNRVASQQTIKKQTTPELAIPHYEIKQFTRRKGRSIKSRIIRNMEMASYSHDLGTCKEKWRIIKNENEDDWDNLTRIINEVIQ